MWTTIPARVICGPELEPLYFCQCGELGNVHSQRQLALTVSSEKEKCQASSFVCWTVDISTGSLVIACLNVRVYPLWHPPCSQLSELHTEQQEKLYQSCNPFKM